MTDSFFVIETKYNFLSDSFILKNKNTDTPNFLCLEYYFDLSRNNYDSIGGNFEIIFYYELKPTSNKHYFGFLDEIIDSSTLFIKQYDTNEQYISVLGPINKRELKGDISNHLKEFNIDYSSEVIDDKLYIKFELKDIFSILNPFINDFYNTSLGHIVFITSDTLPYQDDSTDYLIDVKL